MEEVESNELASATRQASTAIVAAIFAVLLVNPVGMRQCGGVEASSSSTKIGPLLYSLYSLTNLLQPSMSGLAGAALAQPPLVSSILPSSSTAGVGTNIVVSISPSPTLRQPHTSLPTKPLKVSFDMGGTVSAATTAANCSTVFVSHAHADHVMGIFAQARAHRLQMGKERRCR